MVVGPEVGEARLDAAAQFIQPPALRADSARTGLRREVVVLGDDVFIRSIRSVKDGCATGQW
jgi:hypothetical protein